MPSGRTHDRITLWTLPATALLVGLASRDPAQVLIFASGYLVGGLLLSPDLDIHSRPYLRWGPLRWIWLPYRKVLHHRSMLSHGPLFGTLLRLLYLGSWVLALATIGLICWAQYESPEAWQQLTLLQLQRGLTQVLVGVAQHPLECLIAFLGLEIGAMSHSLSDWTYSYWKRLSRRGRGRQGKK